VIVIPSRPGIPVVINGWDASYAIVEGDWGLARPGHGSINIIGGSPLAPSHVYHPRNSYHPAYGRPPARGRNEVEPGPDRPLPEQPESFSRGWSTSSEVVPVTDTRRAEPSSNPPETEYAPATLNDPQQFNPPVVVAPRVGPRERRPLR
jgi:hypothetical protein